MRSIAKSGGDFRWLGFLCALWGLVGANAWAGELASALGSDEFQAQLDRVTRSPRTLNRVDLYHLGKTSRPMRIKEISEAQSTLFQAIPYWYNDRSSQQMLDLYEAKSKEPGFEIRLLMDWSSPASTGDLLKTKQYKRLKALSSGRLIFWNDPAWMESWSHRIGRFNLHEKLLILDGKKLILGGINISDQYLYGGEDPEGWHDTDFLIQGPIVQEAMRAFLKTYQLGAYLKSLKPFPSQEKQIISSLQSVYFENEVRPQIFKTLFGKMKFDLGLMDVFKNTNYFPLASEDHPPMGAVPARFIYTNPMVDRDPDQPSEFKSPLYETLRILLGKAEKRARFFIPYLTLSPQMEKLFQDTAQRGVRVEVITNSLKSHDIGTWSYYGALGHYLPLAEKGVVIHEWQGHKNLQEIEKREGCKVQEWPGRTLHTKAVIIDDDVVILGSHNFNIRSEFYNSETMVMVESQGLTAQLNQIFEQDLDVPPPEGHWVLCGDRLVERSRKVETLSLEHIRQMTRENRSKIRSASKLQHLM
jgi:putative cardiolipin synthase